MAACDENGAKMIVAYWPIRGLAQPIRMACALGGLDFENKTYMCEDKDANGHYDKSSWFDVKHSLGLDLPNLPYLIETDGKSFTETVAILTYVCEKGGLMKEYSEFEKAKALALALEVQDIRNKAVRLFYRTYDDQACAIYVDTIKPKFKALERIMEKNEDPLSGLINKPGFCAADIHLAEMIYQHELLRPGMFTEFPTLLRFAQAFFQQKVIVDMEAELKYPINNKMARWGSEYMEGPPLLLDAKHSKRLLEKAEDSSPEAKRRRFKGI